MNTLNNKILLALIGNPVSHSKSPIIHNTWAKELNLNLEYTAIKVENIKDFMKWFEHSNLLGFNITIPYKETIIPYLDKISVDAKSIAAVNTVIRLNGETKGYNTDILGIEITLKEHISKDSKVLVIGAGGASRAVLRYLNNNAIKPFVMNRSPEKLTNLKTSFKFDVISEIKKNDEFDIIINTTPVGMIDNESPINLSDFTRDPKFVFDLIYKPEMTALLTQAQKRNIEFKNGNTMLFEQAKQSFKIWTGIYP